MEGPNDGQPLQPPLQVAQGGGPGAPGEFPNAFHNTALGRIGAVAGRRASRLDCDAIRRRGGRARLKAPVLKTGIPQGIGGSNPSPSAIFPHQAPAAASTTVAAPVPLGVTTSRRAWNARSVLRWPTLTTVVAGSRWRSSP